MNEKWHWLCSFIVFVATSAVLTENVLPTEYRQPSEIGREAAQRLRVIVETDARNPVHYHRHEKDQSRMNVARRMLIVVCLIACPNAPLAAEDWPHWRGPSRNDIVAESSGWTVKGWIANCPSWQNNVGEGSSSPIIVGQHLFAMGWRDQQDSVYCLNAATGKEIWSVSYKCPQYGRLATGDEGLHSGPTSPPEYDAATGFLYTLSGDGDLNCWDTNKRGSRVWGVNLYEQYAVKRRPRVGRSGLRDYGYTTAPLVHGDWLIVEVGADAGTLVAFAKSTGKQVWLS